MSGATTIHSGEAGTTGREVFEHSTATGPGPGYGKDHGQSATSGFEGSDGIGRGGKVDHHHDTSGGAPAVTGSAGHDLVGGTAGASGRQTEGGDPHADTGAHLPGSTGTGGGVPPPAPAGEVHQGHHHHHHHHQEATGTGIGASETVSVSSLLLLFEFQSLRPLQSAIRDTYGDNAPGGAGGGVTDRVGSLNQGGAMYERTTDQGPITGGAAGTDRFDTDKPRAGNAPVQDAYPDMQESTTRAEGKSSGGVMGVLGTSDKDFTGRDRLGSGAYADTDGRYQSNTTGPGGHTALTGREGNLEKNPVAQAKGMSTTNKTGSDPTPPHRLGQEGNAGVSSANDDNLVSSTGHGTGMDENMLNKDGLAPKKGFAQKLKEMF